VKIWVPVINFKAIELGTKKKSYTIPQSHQNSSKKRLPKFLIISVVILLVTVGLVMLVVHNLNAPAEGTITRTELGATPHISDTYTQPALYKGKYLSFTYPAHYKPTDSQLSGNYLEVADFFATDHSSRQISVGVTKENVVSDSGLVYRQRNPQLYKSVPNDKPDYYVFTSGVNGSESTAFVGHQGLVVAISLSAPAGRDLNPDLQTILNSLKWAQ
jgi:hypothetical protein